MADLDFGTLKPGQQAQKTHSFVGTEAGEAVTVSGDGFSIVTGPAETAPFGVTLRFIAGLVPAGTKSGTLVRGGESVTLEATVVHELTVQSSVACGTRDVGTSTTTTAVVTNRSDTSATLAVSPSQYTVSPASVPPGTGPHAVTITFTPAAVADYPGTLSATAGSLTGSGTLSGAGVAPGTSATGSLGVDSLETTSSGGATKTTYKVHVPSFETKLHLGAAVTPFTHLDGFGLRTAAKGLLHATGDIGINTSEGNVKIQAVGSGSDDGGGVFTVSKNNSVFAAGGSAYLVGDGGVTISTALDVEPAVGTDGLPAPGEMTAGSSVASGVFAALDGIVALASLGRVAYTTWKGFKDLDKLDVALAGVSAGSAFTAVMLNGFSVANAAGASFAVPGVTIYGHAGVLIGTPGFGSFYATAGMVLGSIFPVVIGMDAELLGLRTANVTGKHVNLQGLTDISLKGGTEVAVESETKVAIRVNKLGVKNTETSAITLEDHVIRMKVGDPIVGTTYLAKMDNAGIAIGVDSDGSIDASKPSVKIDDSSIKLTMKDGGALVTLEDGKVTIESKPDGTGIYIEDGLVSIYDAASGGKHMIKVQDNGIEITGGGSANKVQLSSNGIVAKGSMIKWG